MGRKILVYGGTGGIGSAVSRRLHDRGDELHLVARDEEKLTALAGELDAGWTAGDVLDSGLYTRVTDDIGGPIDGLVYAVGTINLRRLPRLKEDDFLNDYRVNALGAALAVQAALDALQKSEPGASVVLFSSVAASQGFSMHTSVGMAKGAVSALALALAAELAPKVRVNAIAPSLVQTPLAAGLLGNEQVAASIADLHALKRIGDPDDIAAMTDFLLSPESSWISGQVIGVDGGRSTLRTKG